MLRLEAEVKSARASSSPVARTTADTATALRVADGEVVAGHTLHR